MFRLYLSIGVLKLHNHYFVIENIFFASFFVLYIIQTFSLGNYSACRSRGQCIGTEDRSQFSLSLS